MNENKDFIKVEGEFPDECEACNVIPETVWEEVEVHENCTVQILKNKQTGAYSIGWYENDKPPIDVK